MLGVTKGKSGGVYMILKTRMELAQNYNVFNYGPPIPHKFTKSQDITKSGRSKGFMWHKINSTREKQRESWQGKSPRCVNHE